MKQKTLLLLLVLALALAACQQTPDEPEATETSLPPTATEVVPTEEPTDEPTEVPTEAPTEVPTAEPTEEPAPEPAEIALEERTNDVMGLNVLVPEGWGEVGPGAYARQQAAGDVTTLIQQAAAGVSAEQLSTALLPQLGITELPEPAGTLEGNSLTWTLYEIEVEAPQLGTVVIDLALAEAEGTTYLVLLQTTPDEYPALHEAVFLPALEAFAPQTEESESNIYEDPAGTFSVPVPTNWTVDESDEYVTLIGPDEQLEVHILALPGEEAKAAVEQAWQIVDPDFDRAETETQDLPESAAGGVDEFILVNYEMDEGQPIVQVEGRRYQGQVYVLIFVLDLEAYQQRAAQIQLIDSGFKITDLEEVDLSGTEPAALSEEMIADLESYVQEQMATLDVPGLAMAIVRGDEVVYSNSFGVRDRDTEEPVTPETLMMIGSTTKPLTTMMMAHLVDEGVFDWDTPVQEILPSFQVADPDLSSRLTMRNLVCACTGVPRRDFEWLFNANEMDAQDVIESVADFEFFTDFGETFQYSNQMVATAGYVSTLAAGGQMDTLLADYTSLMQQTIFDPMEMDETTFSFEQVASTENHAAPYGQSLVGGLVELPLSTEEVLLPAAPAGALWSNVLDMSNFVITLLNQGQAPDGEQVVSAENLAVTWEPQVEISADASYGLGWIIEEYKGLQVISHAGNTFGFTSELAFVPEADLGVVILTNQQHSSANAIIRIRLLEMLYGLESEVDELVAYSLEQSAAAQEEMEASLVEIAPETVETYLGEYQSEELGAMSLAWDEDQLVLDAGEFQAVIRAVEDEDDGEISYLTSTPPIAGMPVEFSEDDQGNPTIVFGTGVVEYVFTKVE